MLRSGNNVIQKGLAFVREQSSSVTVPGAKRAHWGSAPPAACRGGAVVVVAANDAAPTQRRIPMSRFTDTQLVILSSALRRNDRGVDLPANVSDEAVRKAVDKLIRAGLAGRGPRQRHDRQATSPLNAVLCFGNQTCPFNMYFQYINGRPVTLIHQPTQCSLAGLSGRVGVTFPP
jgi:hypothetical protein